MDTASQKQSDSDRFNKEILEMLSQFKNDTINAYRNNSSRMMRSRLYAHFPHLLKSTYEGCLVKCSDRLATDDAQYVDIDQEISIKTHEGRNQKLFSATRVPLMPFSIREVELTSSRLSLKICGNVKAFELNESEFSIWFLPKQFDPHQLALLFEILLESAKAELVVQTSSGQKIIPVNLVQKEKYTCHFNERMRLRYSDLTWYQYIDIILEDHIGEPIQSMKLDIYCERFYCLDNNPGPLEIHTNIIPCANRARVHLNAFMMDGLHEIYWLDVEEQGQGARIYEVLQVIVNDEVLVPFLDYEVIDQDDRVGIRFLNIVKVYQQEVTGLLEVDLAYDGGDIDLDSKPIWAYAMNKSEVLSIASLISKRSSSSYGYQLITKALSMLKLYDIQSWTESDWRLILTFIGQYLSCNLLEIFKGVECIENTIKFNFRAQDQGHCALVKARAHAVKDFIQYHTRYLPYQYEIEVGI